MKTMRKNNRKSSPFVIAVIGPTASGKSGLAVDIARVMGGEILSADSRQVYIGLDIGTGKVTKKEMRDIPHHLLDITSPKRQLSAEVWKKKAKRIISDIQKRGNIPVVCGGTGLYVDALLRGLSFPEVAPNFSLRKRLERRSTTELYLMLKKLDPRRAGEIDRANPRRLIRAIEIAHALGKVPEKTITPPPYRVLWIGINPKDAVLKKRIHVRLLSRLKYGMIREAEQLHKKGLSYKRMRELGLEYRFLADYLEKRLTKKEMQEGLEKAIWQYVKRQRTWWKRYKDIHWLTSSNPQGALRLVKDFLK
jgi:tRNA dimethylallyltransferase